MGLLQSGREVPRVQVPVWLERTFPRKWSGLMLRASKACNPFWYSGTGVRSWLEYWFHNGVSAINCVSRLEEGISSTWVSLTPVYISVSAGLFRTVCPAACCLKAPLHLQIFFLFTPWCHVVLRHCSFVQRRLSVYSSFYRETIILTVVRAWQQII